MICIPIVAPNSNGALKDIKNASRIADLSDVNNIKKNVIKVVQSKFETVSSEEFHQEEEDTSSHYEDTEDFGDDIEEE